MPVTVYTTQSVCRKEPEQSGSHSFQGQERGEGGRERHTAIDLLARLSGIRPLLITNKREALRPAGLAILCQKNARDAAKALKDLTQILLLRELGHLAPSATRQPPSQPPPTKSPIPPSQP